MCALRNKNIVDQIQVIGNADNYELSRQEFSKAGIDSYKEIIETVPRNTAASIAFAAFTASPEDILLVTPSDHVIEGEELYAKAVKEAIALAQEHFIVTFGAIPSRPETGYGYMEHDETFTVTAFKEKPDLETAQQYLDSGRYLWNSGMFCFKASVYLAELKKYAPKVYDTAYAAIQNADQGFLLLEDMMEIPSISVDYAVMERSDIIKVVPFSFEWSDLGSFDALWEHLEKNGHHQRNLVLGSHKHVEFIGLEDIVLVETDDAILVLPRNKAQEVKALYEKLETEKPELLK